MDFKGHVAPDFQLRLLLQTPISVVENGGQSGPVAADLAQRLAAGRTPLPVGLGPQKTPFRIVAELTEDSIGHVVDRDTHCSTEYIHDECGEVVDSYEVIEDYETTARTWRRVAATYRIEEMATGRPLWVAETKRKKSRTFSRRSSWDDPAPPPFPMEAPLHAVTSLMNEGIAASIEKLVRSSPPKAEVMELSSVSPEQP